MTELAVELLEILACPCPKHAPVQLHGEQLVCTACSTAFEVRDGIPVMLLDEATPGPNGIGELADGDRPDGS